MEFLPLFLKLERCAALVVGGGPIAARKIQLLCAVGANITVVAPQLCAEIAELATARALTHISAAFVPALIGGQRLVIAATDDPVINQVVAETATAAGILVNVVDDLALSTCIVPAIIDRSPILVACSTGGTSPVLATEVRAQIETLLPPNLGDLGRFARRHRAEVKARIPDLGARRLFWTAILRGNIASLLLAGQHAAAEQAMAQALATAKAPNSPQCQLVTVTSGDPDRLTLGTLRGLYTAEIVLHDQGIAPEILAYARRDAERRIMPAAATAFEFLQARTVSIGDLARSSGIVVYLSEHSGAWGDLLAGALRAQGVLTKVS